MLIYYIISEDPSTEFTLIYKHKVLYDSSGVFPDHLGSQQ